MRRIVLRVLEIYGVLAGAMCWVGAATACGITFEFDVDGVLPSAQGATYSGSGNFAESQAYSVSGGILTENTLQFLPQDAFAYYVVQDVFDHSNDATLEWTAKVWSGVGYGLLGIRAQVSDGVNAWDFFLDPGGVVHTTNSGRIFIATLDTTDDFHTYRVEIPASSTSFDFYIDDVHAYSGVASAGSGINRLLWGDSTISGGSGVALWDRIALTGAGPAGPGDMDGDCDVDVGDLILLERQLLEN